MKVFQWHEQARQKWDEMSDYWHQNSQLMWETGSRKTVLPLFSRFVPANPSSLILDAGCGDGYGSYKLYQSGYRVIGADISERMIRKAKERVENEGLDFIQGDLGQLPFASKTFSAILSINAIEWTESPLQTLNELRRVVKTDGILCLGILGPTAAPRKNSYARLYEEKVVCHTIMPWECERLCKENGWEILHGEGVYKEGVTDDMVSRLSIELRQALSFLWLFIMKKVE